MFPSLWPRLKPPGGLSMHNDCKGRAARVKNQSLIRLVYLARQGGQQKRKCRCQHQLLLHMCVFSRNPASCLGIRVSVQDAALCYQAIARQLPQPPCRASACLARRGSSHEASPSFPGILDAVGSSGRFLTSSCSAPGACVCKTESVILIVV